MKRILFFGLAILFTMNSYSQNKVNNYKYILVPEGYGFLKENDAYQLNSLTKFLFNKYGFTAFILSDELPIDLNNNGCNTLKADVKKHSGVFRTKLTVDLIDCNGITIFSSKEGWSKEKQYKRAYQEALRDAFKDIKALNYRYNKKPTVIGQKEEVSDQPVVSNNAITTNTVHDKAKVDKAEIVSNNANVSSITYMYNEEIYAFEKQAYGFELMQKKNEKPVSVGKVFKSNRDNTYIIKAGDLSGNGYFDAYGNFILERINPATNKLITDTFARQ